MINSQAVANKSCMMRCSPRATGLQLKQYARPFDQNLGSPLMYLLYMHATIQQKYVFFFHLIFLFCPTIRPKIRVLIDLFFYMHVTMQQKYTVVFHLFFLLSTTIRPKIRVHTNFLFYFVHNHTTKIYGPLSFILSFVLNHFTKN